MQLPTCRRRQDHSQAETHKTPSCCSFGKRSTCHWKDPRRPSVAFSRKPSAPFLVAGRCVAGSQFSKTYRISPRTITYGAAAGLSQIDVSHRRAADVRQSARTISADAYRLIPAYSTPDEPPNRQPRHLEAGRTFGAAAVEDNTQRAPPLQRCGRFQQFPTAGAGCCRIPDRALPPLHQAAEAGRPHQIHWRR